MLVFNTESMRGEMCEQTDLVRTLPVSDNLTLNVDDILSGKCSPVRRGKAFHNGLTHSSDEISQR